VRDTVQARPELRPELPSALSRPRVLCALAAEVLAGHPAAVLQPTVVAVACAVTAPLSLPNQ